MKLSKGERSPVDGVALATLSSEDLFFIKTDQLDGETDWKPRLTVKKTQILANKNCFDLIKHDWSVIASSPNANLQDFEAVFVSNEDDTEEKITMRNFLLTGVKIESDEILLLTTYVGGETKVHRNSVQKTIDKNSCINTINSRFFLLCVTVTILASFGISVYYHRENFNMTVFYDFFQIFTILLLGLPLVIKVNLICHRLLHLLPEIQNDPLMNQVLVRNPQVIEDLGAIEILISDKTGTLTQNDMKFKHLMMPTLAFEMDQFKYLKQQVFMAYEKLDCRWVNKIDQKFSDFNSFEIFNSNVKVTENENSFKNSSFGFKEDIFAAKIDGSIRCQNEMNFGIEIDEKETNIRWTQLTKTNQSFLNETMDIVNNDLYYEKTNVTQLPNLSALKTNQINGIPVQNYPNECMKEMKLIETLEGMIVCNNVIPIFEDGIKSFQSSSPDELAIIYFLESLGFLLEKRTLNMISYINPIGRKIKLEIKEFYPFSSEKKKMGILVQNIETQEMVYYMKGADSVFGQNLRLDDLNFIEENCLNLANVGLRTLVVACKKIDENQYVEWKQNQLKKMTKGHSKQSLDEKLNQKFEKDVDLLCVTGIEDRLQDEVKNTLQRLREANIQLWMLTGDKFETAKSIAISSGMKPNGFGSIEIIYPQLELIQNAIAEFNIERKVIFASGDCFDLIFENKNLRNQFFEKISKCCNINVFRCSPKQKTKIVSYLKENLGKTVCCVGDGGNDVGMIKKSSVGLGIRGKEGLQASLAADFSISDFKDINGLIFWHGRNALINSSHISLFTFYRAFMFILSIIMFIFCFSGFVEIVYRPIVILMYSNMLTGLMSIPFTQKHDLTRSQIMNYARLYRTTQNNQIMSIKNMLKNFFTSFWQMTTIYFLVFWFYPKIDYNFFSFLIFVCVHFAVYMTSFTKLKNNIGSFLEYLTFIIFLIILNNLKEQF